MRKKLLFLTAAVIICLFAGCPLNSPKPKTEDVEGKKTTRLTINNQSSIKFVYDTIEKSTVTTLHSGDSFTDELSTGVNGYIHLRLSWTDYEGNNWATHYDDITRKDVRTHEPIVVEEGQHKTITITDNTLVVPKGGSTAITIADLKPSVLHAEFDFSEWKPDKISYKGIRAKDYIAGNYFIVCDEPAEDFIKFDFLDLPVQTLEKITLEKGIGKKIFVSDTTKFIVYDKTCTGAQLEKLRILTVTNSSSAVIKDLMYYDDETNDLYKGNLANGEQCNLSSYRFYDKYDFAPSLKFTLITKTGKELKATLHSSNLKISDGRHKDFSVNDYTEVSVSFVDTYKTEPLEYFFNEKYEG